MPTKILMPALSPTMTEGKLSKWVKKEGDVVSAGDVIAEIETDKATMEVEAVDEGTLAKIVVAEGTDGVAVNAAIAVLLEDGETANDLEGFDLSDAAAPASQDVPAAQQAAPSAAPMAPAAHVAPAASNSDRVLVSPLARRMAQDAGIDLVLPGSGPKGRIIKADVERAIANKNSGAAVAAPARPAGPNAQELADMLGMEYEAIPNNAIKKVVAERLQESKQTVPHFYLTIDCRIDALLAERKKINEAANGAYKISVNDLILKASALALQEYPAANTAWTDDNLIQYVHSDISVAVATENGLITPIVKEAENKSLEQISADVKDLASRAKKGALKPTEFQGGTFTVSNLGMFGIKEFGAIINPPQACILAVGAGAQQPVVDNGEIKVGTVMCCTLSVDHRAVDGAVGAEFLQIFKRYIEDPSLLVE